MTINPKEMPRCGAKTRSGQPCRKYSMSNGKCRNHGGLSTGPKTAEGLERSRKANWKNGRYSQEAKRERKILKDFLQKCRKTIKEIKCSQK